MTGDGPADGDEVAKPDLRFTGHEADGLRVERKLDGSGRLARGDHTRMSSLNFSSRHVARDERDPEFTFRPAPDDVPSTPAETASTPPVSMLDRVKRLFGA